MKSINFCGKFNPFRVDKGLTLLRHRIAYGVTEIESFQDSLMKTFFTKVKDVPHNPQGVE